jgi:subtilisin family serine protease
MKHGLMSVCLAAFTMLVSSSMASAMDSATAAKISPWLLSKMKNSRADLPALVYLKEQADVSQMALVPMIAERRAMVYDALRQSAQRTQKDLVSYLDSRGVIYKRYYIANMIAIFDASAEEIEAIASRDDVLRVMANNASRVVTPKLSLGNDKDATRGPGANIVRVGADRVWKEFKTTGEGIVVGNQDTGMEWDHPALKPHYRGMSGRAATHDYNWHDAIPAKFGSSTSSCGYDRDTPCDDNGHGTHTMGTVVGDDNAGNQVGVAPGAKWIGCRNMDAGFGRPSSYIECFEWFLAPYPYHGNSMTDGKPELAADVINNSWGCPKEEGCEGGEFEPVLKALQAAGIFVVASAGNEGSGCSTIEAGPAFNTDFVMSVGAVNHRDDKIADFSSRGPSTFDNKVGPHISAPGVNIRSSVQGGSFSSFMWSGTSMAGPHVVGGVALLWSGKPELAGNIEATHELLRKTADTKITSESCGGVPGTSIPNNTFGWGIMNLYKAMQ